MKTAAIVADNYKLEKFKRELTAKGFTDFEVSKHTNVTSYIYVNIEESQFRDIEKICHYVELYFKRSN